MLIRVLKRCRMLKQGITACAPGVLGSCGAGVCFVPDTAPTTATGDSKEFLQYISSTRFLLSVYHVQNSTMVVSLF